jgi:hypothetical protein
MASMQNSSPYAAQQEMSAAMPPPDYQQYPQSGTGQYMGGPSGYGYPYGNQTAGSVPQPYGYYPMQPAGTPNMPMGAGAAPAMGTPVTGYPVGGTAVSGTGAYCNTSGYPTPGKMQGG